MRKPPKLNKEPSLRDKLSAAYLETFQADFAANGASVIEQLRQKSPERYAEIAARLIAASEPRSDGFENAQSMEDIGLKLLRAVGFDAPDDASIEAAIKANDDFIEQLKAIRDRAQN